MSAGSADLVTAGSLAPTLPVSPLSLLVSLAASAFDSLDATSGCCRPHQVEAPMAAAPTSISRKMMPRLKIAMPEGFRRRGADRLPSKLSVGAGGGTAGLAPEGLAVMFEEGPLAPTANTVAHLGHF